MRSTKARHKKKKSKHRIQGFPSNNKTYVGYCHNRNHRGWLTLQLLVEHDCLGKECTLLEKCNDHPLWRDRKFVTKQISYKQLKRIKEHIVYPKTDKLGYDIQPNILQTKEVILENEK